MLLSIITVTLNCVDTIERTIESIVSQKNDEIEYIIIDGGSTDGTLDIVKKYDNQIDYWISEPDNGIYDAMNKGIGVASGEWINFMNGNDWFEDNSIAEIVGFLKAESPKLLYGRIKVVNNGEFEGYSGVHGIEGEFNSELINIGNYYCHQGLFTQTLLFDQIGLYSTDYKIYSDYEWLLRAHNAGINPVITNIDVGYFSRGGISSSGAEHKERLELSIKNTINHCDSFDTELNKKLHKMELEYLSMYGDSLLSDELSKYESIYMWGIGDIGSKIYRLLKRNSITVANIISSDYSIKEWNGEKVEHYTRILPELSNNDDLEYLIIISTEKYEGDILDIIFDYEISSRHIMTTTYLYQYIHSQINKFVYR